MMWMKSTVMGLAVVGLLASSCVHAATTIYVKGGDVDGLRKALTMPDPDTHTVQIRQGTFVIEGAPIEINVPHVEGYGSRTILTGKHKHQLLVVPKGKKVRIERLVLTNATRALTNHGDVEIKKVRFKGNRPNKKTDGHSGFGLLNFGSAKVDRSSFEDNGPRFQKLEEGSVIFGSGIENFGRLEVDSSSFVNGSVAKMTEKDKNLGSDIGNHGHAEVLNSTFWNYQKGARSFYQFALSFSGFDGSVVNGVDAEMRIVHATFVDDEVDFKQLQPIVNLGQTNQVMVINSFVDRGLPSTVVSQGVNLSKYSQVSTWGSQDDGAETFRQSFVGPFRQWYDTPNAPFEASEKHILPYALGLAEGSPLIDAADPLYCPPADINGVSRYAPKCDVGAFERRGANILKPFADKYSGSWVMEGRDKEGLVIESLPGEKMQAFLFDYQLVYGHGTPYAEQAWHMGVDDDVSDGLFRTKMTTLYGEGGRFGQAMNRFYTREKRYREGRNLEEFQFRIHDCHRGEIVIAGESVALRRLTVPLGVDCDTKPSVSDFSNKKVIDSGINGTWYPPSHSGQGFFVEVLPNQTVQAFYFGFSSEKQRKQYNESQPLFLVGQAAIQGDLVKIDAHQTASSDDMSERIIKDWGTMTLKFNSCNDAEVWFDGLDGKDYLKLKRLTSWVGNSCK